ncbi:MAG: leucyl/phenylalanyl-tRNA--protein transferase [bacterium]|nr:leucyl/phenylalanyl-tRNA--protein transferase [bacterium]
MIDKTGFPDPRQAEDHGLVAIGGDYRPELLVAAYAHGIFPWPNDNVSHAWFSPNPRMVLLPEELHVSRSLAKTLRRGRFRVTYDTAFEQVSRCCARIDRPGQDGTWITEELRAGFVELHHLGLAHSVETWRGDRLVGGLYGLSLGTMFCGESMFHLEPDASKVAFVALVRRLRGWSFRLVDCQVHTGHLEQLGAHEWPRDRFLDEVEMAVQYPTRPGPWTETES